ncbi:MAG: FAD-dependent oxidoreductase [Spirochaetia bacterium]|nr:FAD-dependent oxidoreductase [Spirochaetia bacterium]
MEFIQENLSTRVVENCDVLVAGGGIAGIAASLAAARAGAKVTMIEKSWILGGLATSGLIAIYLPLCDGMGHQVSFGICHELFMLSIKHMVENRYPKAWLENGTFEEKKNGKRFEVQYNASLFALEAEKLLKQNNVRILYGTSICSIQKDNDRINAVIAENKSGRFAITFRNIVDATGDADICRFAGMKTETFKAGNVLAAWYYSILDGGLKLNQLGAAEIPDEEKTGNEKAPLISRRFGGNDGFELSEMMQLSHEQTLRDIVLKRKTDPTHIPTSIATIPQIRMTRKIVGEYTLDAAEEHKYFEDSIGMISNWKKRGPIYEVPFRTLYNKDVKNLITAGRNISVTELMWDISRVIPSCAVTGEAAGIAAACYDDIPAIDVKDLQKKLVAGGVVLHEKDLNL